MKVAIIYDRVNKWGGAERVLLAMHEIFPEAPLYTSVYEPKSTSWTKVFPKVIPSFLNKVSYFRVRHELLPLFMPIAFESFNFDDFDLAISVTSEAAKGIITKPKCRHICYCLTPTRYLWSHYEDYFKSYTFKELTKPAVGYLRNWDKIAAYRPDKMVAISNEVKDRIKKYYDRESEVIFPPAEADKFMESRVSIELKIKNYYLVVSRLVPYKKVDLVVETFNRLGFPLVVIGTGSEEQKLKNSAKGNITFTGYVDDIILRSYYQNAKAVIFPQEEDFGIVPVEAQASGCPVIAYKKGGALDTVIDGKTGLFFNSQDADTLTKTILNFEKKSFNKKLLRENSEKFAKDRFKEQFIDLIKRNV